MWCSEIARCSRATRGELRVTRARVEAQGLAGTPEVDEAARERRVSEGKHREDSVIRTANEGAAAKQRARKRVARATRSPETTEVAPRDARTSRALHEGLQHTAVTYLTVWLSWLAAPRSAAEVL